MKKYNEITLLHVIACCMILLCHFFQDAGIGSLGEIFLAGLSVFFIVSGFLTGFKPRYNAKWLGSRFKRILVPYYIIMLICVVLIVLFTNGFNAQSALHLITATQGINYLFWPYQGYGAMTGLGHLWYITIILICFTITPVLDWLYKRISPSLKSLYLFLLILICAVQPVMMFMGIQISYIISFMIGYLIAKKNYVFTGRRYAGIVIIFLIVTAIRFIGMKLIDGSDFYDRYIALVSQGSLAVVIYSTVFFLGCKVPKAVASLAQNYFIVLFASIIYEVYLVHYFFLRGPWPVKNYIHNIYMADLTVAALSILFALAISKIVKRVTSSKTILTDK
jgi:peptidoglycan/LPS O-acetylase OafA/YrhL